MRYALALLLLAGCRLAPAEGSADASASGPAVAEQPAPTAPLAGPADAPLDTFASVPADHAADTLDVSAAADRAAAAALAAMAFDALVASVDMTVLGGYGVFLSAGVFHGDEVPARDGEVWQAVYPTATGAELRTVPLRVEVAQDVVLDPDEGPYTGRRVTTPFSVLHRDVGWVQDSARVFVRRAAGPFPGGPVPVAAVDVPWLEPGVHDLALDGARYTLLVEAGPAVGDRQWERVVSLVGPDGTRQAVAHLVDRDDAHPALVWAGDLDGDGRLDLVLDETWARRRSTCRARPRPAPSSAAWPGTRRRGARALFKRMCVPTLVILSASEGSQREAPSPSAPAQPTPTPCRDPSLRSG
jgi:hypothetical protein